MSDDHLELYAYWRSSASYRVRIALALKGLEAKIRPVHLVRNGGQQHGAEFLAINPQGLVPCLVHGQTLLTQSLAIIEYLDERFPIPPLLPNSPADRARARMLAQSVACDLHPLNNLRVLKFLETRAKLTGPARMDWYRHWTESGLRALEKQLRAVPGEPRFSVSDQPGLTDCCLLPQLYNARRFDCSLDGCERFVSICERLASDKKIEKAAPENQPDAE